MTRKHNRFSPTHFAPAGGKLDGLQHMRYHRGLGQRQAQTSDQRTMHHVESEVMEITEFIVSNLLGDALMKQSQITPLENSAGY